MQGTRPPSQVPLPLYDTPFCPPHTYTKKVFRGRKTGLCPDSVHLEQSSPQSIVCACVCLCVVFFLQKQDKKRQRKTQHKQFNNRKKGITIQKQYMLYCMYCMCVCVCVHTAHRSGRKVSYKMFAGYQDTSYTSKLKVGLLRRWNALQEVEVEFQSAPSHHRHSCQLQSQESSSSHNGHKSI